MKKINLLLSAASLLLLAGCGETATSSAPASSKAEESVAESVAPASVETSSVNEDGTTTYVFEAEYNEDLEFMKGPAFSGTYTGLEMVQNDTRNKDYQASNGYYVTGLCVKGQTLTFKINSDKAVSDATFLWRVSSEAYDVTLTPDNYSIYVNNKALDYKEIDITDVPAYQQGFKAFEDFTITKRLSLVEGENTFVFYTNNSTALGGTFTATAPMFDCFKVVTDATLTWDPCLSNLNK